MKELWVLYYRLEFDVLTTNNGIEAQNRVLKAHYVKNASRKCSLTSLITALVYSYLPDGEKKLMESEMRQSALYRQYNENIPTYFHGRSRNFIKHMLRTLVNAEEYTRADVAELPINGTFSVHSERTDASHIVDFNKPSCTCLDFCKH